MNKLIAKVEDVYTCSVEIRSNPGLENEDDGFCHLSLIDKANNVDCCAELDIPQIRALRDLLNVVLGED